MVILVQMSLGIVRICLLPCQQSQFSFSHSWKGGQCFSQSSLGDV